MSAVMRGNLKFWAVVVVTLLAFVIQVLLVDSSTANALSIFGYEPTYGEVRTYTENGNRVIYQQMMWTQDRIDYINSFPSEMTYEHSFKLNRNQGSKHGPETWAAFEPGTDGIPNYIRAESNFPSWYVDTTLLADTSDGITAEFTIGTSNAKALKANVTYWSKIVLAPGEQRFFPRDKNSNIFIPSHRIKSL